MDDKIIKQPLASPSREPGERNSVIQGCQQGTAAATTTITRTLSQASQLQVLPLRSPGLTSTKRALIFYNQSFITISLLLTITIFSQRHALAIEPEFSLPSLKTIQDDIENNPVGDSSKDVDLCEACKLVVSSFEKGLKETSRGKHEGGDTSWEEKNLKNYADSEVRLVEIQEMLCEDVKKGKAQCLSLAEDTESEVEEWWFRQRNKNVRLFDYLCISKLKRCCPSGKFGPTCQACQSDCSKHGECDGSGTRSGTGKCNCETGYTGQECADCSNDHFRVATSDHFACRACDSACEGCYGPGRTNCTDCRQGYYKHDTNGCVDINECEVGTDSSGNSRLCQGNKYCINTDGSYKCADCHVSCSGCVGYGPNMCISCARGYQLDEDYSCQSKEDLERFDDWQLRESKGTAARYFFYVGVLAVSVMMFRSNLYVMYTFTLGFVILLVLTELNLLDEGQEYSKVSSE